MHSPREYFHAYLHSLDVDRERLPEDFRGKLARVLAHYRVDGLDRSPDLEEAVFRVFLSQQRTASHLPVVAALLRRWLAEVAPADGVADRVREVLDRLVLATQLRFPAIGDLARSARFRWFEAPIVEAAREEAYAAVRDQLAYLSEHPDAPRLRGARRRPGREPGAAGPVPRRADRRAASPGTSPWSRSSPGGTTASTTSWSSKAHTGRGSRAGRAWSATTRSMSGRTRLLSTVADAGELPALGAWLGEFVDAVPEGEDAVVDLYLSWPDAPADADAGVRRAGPAARRRGRSCGGCGGWRPW